MTLSISSNLAANLAGLNIGNATNAVQNDTAALSSGQRIVKASTDVAALSIGTSLNGQVSALNTALTISGQATSLLQVADGSLSQIQSILQQMQTISTSAQAGDLSDVQRGFLNQEFQDLSSQIDQLASSTNFNGVNLINGAISGQAGVTSNSTNALSGLTSNASAQILSVATNPTAAQTVTIDGVKVTFSTSAQGSTAAAGDVVIGNSAADTAANLAAFLNSSNDPQFANLEFVATGAALTANYTGGTLLGTQDITSSTSSTTDFAGTGTAAISATTAGNTADNSDGLTIDRYAATGSVSGSILVTGNNTAKNFGAAINVADLENNASFIGQFGGANIGDITGSYTGTANNVNLSLTVGGITYTTGAVDLSSAAAPITATFTGADSTGAAAGGSFTLTFNGAGQAFASQSQLDPIVTQLNQALAGVSIAQNRTLTSVTNGGIVTTSGGVQVGNLQGLSAQLKSSDFTNANISSLTVSAPAAGSTDAKITAVINGDTYVSVGGIGSSIGLNTVIALQDTSNPANIFSITTGNTAIANSSTTALDLSTAAGAAAVQTALQTAFGLNNAGASLSFQVGTTASDSIGVSLGNASTNTLFNGQSIDVSTASDAATAYNVVSNALNTIGSYRASVGALELEFQYASAAAQSGQQNESAAASSLLSTDVAATSTQFATDQVSLQAGIAVLAQANQLDQAALKLLG